MNSIRIAAAQFEMRNGDKQFNLAAMERLVARAVDLGAEVVSFHEACIPAYSFVRHVNKETIHGLAEAVPDGPSTKRLMAMSRECGVPILAGLIEHDAARLEDGISGSWRRCGRTGGTITAQ